MELEEYKDMFGLYYRVKEIRPTYSLMFNRKTKMVELYDSNYSGICMAFKSPINANILNKINSTRMENSSKIFRKIDENNAKIEQNLLENAIYLAKQTIKR